MSKSSDRTQRWQRSAERTHKMDYHEGSNKRYPKKKSKNWIEFISIIKKKRSFRKQFKFIDGQRTSRQTLWEFCFIVFAPNCWNSAATETIVPHNCSNRPYSLLFASCKLLPFQNCWICSVQNGNKRQWQWRERERKMSSIFIHSVR